MFDHVQKLFKTLEKTAQDGAAFTTGHWDLLSSEISRFSQKSRESFGDLYQKVKDYTQSEEFETQLNQFAESIGLNFNDPDQPDWNQINSQDRAQRIAAKSRLVLETCGKDIAAVAATAGGAAATLSNRPKNIATASMIFGSAKAGHLFWTALNIFYKIDSKAGRDQPKSPL